jgi:hypothetical protein
MSKTFSFALIGFLLIGLIEYSNGQNISNQIKTKIEEQVDSIFHENIISAEHLEYDQLSRVVDDTHQAGFIVNGSYFAQYDSLINSIKQRSQGIVKQHIIIQKEKITVLSDRIVLLTAYGDTKVEVNDGNIFIAKFFWSFVYEKIGKDWKVIQSHQSSIR